MRSERQALTDIAKLREPGPDGVLRWRVGHVGRKLDAILADVQPEPAPASGTINREPSDEQVNAFKAAWEAENAHPAQGDWDGKPLLSGARTRAGLRAVFALVRPVEGVVLTREEAAVAYDVVQAFRGVQGGRLSDTGFGLRVEALAERLEAAS